MRERRRRRVRNIFGHGAILRPKSVLNIPPSFPTKRGVGYRHGRWGGMRCNCGESALNRFNPEIATWWAMPLGPARLCDFLQQLQADLACPASTAKIFRFAATPNHPYNSRHPVPRRGALAIVTNVGAGCGGRGSVRREKPFAGRLSVSERCLRRRTALKRFRQKFGRRHWLAGWFGEGSCVRQNRVVLAPVAGVKLAEV
jgi:hypothetical protein